LSRGEAELTGPYQLTPRPMARAWEYWTTRLKKNGELPRARRAGGRPATLRASKSRGGRKAREGRKAAGAKR
jgi:hypothetical protein